LVDLDTLNRVQLLLGEKTYNARASVYGGRNGAMQPSRRAARRGNQAEA
jgi:hypothetical protein